MRTGLEHQQGAAHAGARIPVPQVREERTTGYRIESTRRKERDGRERTMNDRCPAEQWKWDKDGCDVCPIEEWCLERKEEMKDVRD